MTRRGALGLGTALGIGALSLNAVPGTVRADHNDLDEDEVLHRFVRGLEDEGYDVPFWSKSVHHDHGPVWVTAVAKESHGDLHGVSFANGDTDYVVDNERTYRDIAETGADVGNRMARKKILPDGDDVIALLGTGGRNQSVGPMMPLVFREGHYEHAENGYKRVLLETAEAQNDLGRSQRDAINLLGGFDVYEDRDRLILVNTLDGWDNGRHDAGEFELSDQGWELQYVEARRGRDQEPKALLREVTHGNSTYPIYGEGQEFWTGDHEVRITDLDDANYLELTVIDGDYHDIVDDADRLPFPQVRNPLGKEYDH